MELSPALLGLIGTCLVAIGTLLGVLVNVRFNRLARIEEQEKQCRAQVFQLKADMQTLWLALEMILKKYPDAEDEVVEGIAKMKARQQQFLHDEAEREATK